MVLSPPARGSIAFKSRVLLKQQQLSVAKQVVSQCCTALASVTPSVTSSLHEIGLQTSKKNTLQHPLQPLKCDPCTRGGSMHKCVREELQSWRFNLLGRDGKAVAVHRGGGGNSWHGVVMQERSQGGHVGQNPLPLFRLMFPQKPPTGRCRAVFRTKSWRSARPGL